MNVTTYTMAQHFAENSCVSFFHGGHYLRFPELEKLAAENLIKNKYLSTFFCYGLHHKYPQLLLLIDKE